MLPCQRRDAAIDGVMERCDSTAARSILRENSSEATRMLPGTSIPGGGQVADTSTRRSSPRRRAATTNAAARVVTATKARATRASLRINVRIGGRLHCSTRKRSPPLAFGIGRDAPGDAHPGVCREPGSPVPPDRHRIAAGVCDAARDDEPCELEPPPSRPRSGRRTDDLKSRPTRSAEVSLANS